MSLNPQVIHAGEQTSSIADFPVVVEDSPSTTATAMMLYGININRITGSESGDGSSMLEVADAAASQRHIRRNTSPFRVTPGRSVSFGGSSFGPAFAANRQVKADFSLSSMPRDKIAKRTLYPWSVHHSVATSNWISTISRPIVSENVIQTNKLRYVQFVFKTEREARKFCKSYAPPKMTAVSDGKCHLCGKRGCFRHCKNCGVCCCEQDLTRWSTRMIPKTYLTVESGKVVRVCKTCDWMSNSFCMSLLQGRHDDALELFETGNINLRTCFADIHREAMFPVHCAVMGGSLEILKWLVDGQQCPISARADSKTGRRLSVQTSTHRTLLDLAMTGKPKVGILAFLIKKGISITDIKDPSLAPKTLEAILLSDFSLNESMMPQSFNIVESIDESVATIEDACNICLECPMDCVLTPCGHQFCCSDCGKQLKRCPVCKADCAVLKVFKS
mmetsp:Transcript_7541/g.9850  ORF Transcript_7541/g.9850 Transcript_7541/m.9850 type:complete len:447 (-) Transcript_7541:370-1710(-)